MTTDFLRSEYYRKKAEELVKSYGLQPGELQWKWRRPETLPDTYDSQEVTAAILDALNREGIPAWAGDAVSCVEQIVKAVWDRPRKGLESKSSSPSSP